MATHDSGGAASGRGGTRVDRRTLLKAIASGAVLLDTACSAPDSRAPERTAPVQVSPHGVGAVGVAESPIRRENRLRGDTGFALSKSSIYGECEVYCSVTSAVAGDSVDVFVSTATTQAARLDLYRIGHYQGLGGRLVSSLPRVATAHQVPYYSLDPNTGLVECAWSKTFSFVIDPSFVTGYYLIKITTDDGFESHVPFIVRETGRTSPLLAQASVTTWQAYNIWGMVNLYSNETDKSVFPGPRGYQVSFDRPYAAHLNVWREEFAMVRWLEQMGYDVAYVTNVDVDRAPELLHGRLLFLSVGHDEYWSLPARNAIQNARDDGLSLAFFSGNAAYRRIRLESSSSGVEHRVITCYKSASLDPHNNAPDTTNDFSARPFARPESELIGLQWAGWAHLDGYPFLVADPKHWIYEGTGVKANEAIGHVIGYEWDVAGRDRPAGLEIVGRSPALHEYGYISRAEASVYYPTPNSFVFASGTIAWSRALSEPDEVDLRLQRVTENILKRALVFPEASVVVPQPTTLKYGSVEHCHVLAGTGRAGSVDGPSLKAEFDSPTGIAVGSDGSLYVCDGGTARIRKVSPDGQVTTIAGSVAVGVRFKTPTGIAVDATDVAYVCDTNNHRIVAVSPSGDAVRFAGQGRGNIDDADPARARFNMPRGIAITALGMYIADFGNDAIRRIDAAGVSTLVTDCGSPTAVAVAPDGTLYFIATCAGNIVRVSPSGERTTLCNLSGDFGDRDGAGELARMRAADGLVYTPGGLIITDTGNNRVKFMAFDEAYTVSTLLGSGQPGSGVGKSTEVMFPRGAAAVSDGYVVTDCLNHRVLWFSI